MLIVWQVCKKLRHTKTRSASAWSCDVLHRFKWLAEFIYNNIYNIYFLRMANGISIGSAVFAQMTEECPYTLQWEPFPLRIAPSHGGMWTPSNTWFHPNSQPKQHLDRFSRFCRAH